MWSQKISSYSLVQFNSLLFVLAFNIGMFKYRLCVIIFRFKTEQRCLCTENMIVVIKLYKIKIKLGIEIK